MSETILAVVETKRRCKWMNGARWRAAMAKLKQNFSLKKLKIFGMRDNLFVPQSHDQQLHTLFKVEVLGPIFNLLHETVIDTDQDRIPS
jgi:hypothetical protein